MSETQKHTKPNVPNLRFPGFSGDWAECSLGDISRITKGAGISKEQRSSEGNPCILYGELYTTYSTEIINEVISKTLLPASGLVKSEANDIIIPASGETAIDISTARCVTKSGVFLGGDLNIIRLKKQDGRFFSYQLNGVRKKDIAKVAQGVSIVHLHGSDLAQIKVYYPSLPEQERISSLLSIIDQRISIQSRVIERYESLIRAIILRSQSSSSSRKVYLREILTERKELNEQGYDICSVSVSRGVVNQVEYLGRSFAAKETAHYHVVHKGDIVYTKSPTGEFPYGIIKQSYLDSAVAVSPLYGVYEPIDYLTGVYLHHFFCSPQNAKNYLHKLIQKGAKNTINITNQHFLDNHISIPEGNTLQGIVAVIETLNKRVDLEKELLAIYREQKDFLMSNLFI